MPEQFCHLHLHTDASVRDGLCVPEKLANRLIEINQPGCAITDHGAMGSCYRAWNLFQSKGLKLIPGVEGYFVDTVLKKESQKQQSHITLLAQNNVGYRNLCEMMSVASINHQHYAKPRVDLSLLSRFSEGIVVLTGCVKSVAMKAAVVRDADAAKMYIQSLQEIYGSDNVYTELQIHECSPRKDADFLIAVANSVGSKVVASNDVHFLKKSDYATHQVLAALSHGTSVAALSRGFQYPREIYLKSYTEMMKVFQFCPESVHNSMEVFEKCNVNLALDGSYMPSFDADIDEYDLLKTLVIAGMKQRRLTKKQEYIDRLKFEMSVIKKLGFAGYFLIVWDMMKWGRSQGIAFGCGRGSVGGSLVCYLLDIHDVDPIKYGLYFERFINPSRVSPPDIDTDIEDSRRGEVSAYINEKYGSAYNIITLPKMHGRSAIKDICRALDVPLSMSIKIADAYPELEQGEHVPLAHALEKSVDLKKFSEQPRYADVFYHLGVLDGIKRNVGVHPAGTVIVPRTVSIYDFCPLVSVKSMHDNPETGKKERSDTVCVGMDMKDIDRAGLMKIDLLGLSTISVISDVCSQNHLDIKSIETDDKQVIDMFAKGDTLGVFQCGRPAMRHQFRQLKPDHFDDVVFMTAAWRPGPMEILPNCYDIRFGRKKPPGSMHPIMRKILGGTYYNCIYQEQLMAIVQEMGGFTLAEADIIRRAIGKKDKELLLRQEEGFVKGCVSKNTATEHDAVKIFDMIKKFAGYGFNKAHAVAYGLNAYRTAYLKKYFPADFYAASLNASKTDDDIGELIDDAESHGIAIYPPHINDSAEHFVGRGDRVIYALGRIKHVGASVAKHIVQVRGEGFSSLEDFLTRVDKKVVNKRAIESFIWSGALDCFGHPRQSLYGGMDGCLQFMSTASEKRKFRDVFGGYGGKDLVIHDDADPNLLTEIFQEIAVLGIRIDDRVFDFIDGLGKQKGGVTACIHNIRSVLQGKVKKDEVLLVCGVVDKIFDFMDSKNRRAKSIIVSDWRQKIKVGVYGEAYASTPHDILEGDIVLAKCRHVDQRLYADKVKMVPCRWGVVKHE